MARRVCAVAVVLSCVLFASGTASAVTGSLGLPQHHVEIPPAASTVHGVAATAACPSEVLEPDAACDATGPLVGRVGADAGATVSLTLDAGADRSRGEPLVPGTPSGPPGASSVLDPAGQALGSGAGTGLSDLEAAGLLGAGLGLSGWLARRPARKAALWFLAAAGLFTRIGADRVMDNAVRARVRKAVEAEPGLTLEEIRSRANVARATASYHVRRLESHGLLQAVHHAGHRRFFVPAALADGTMQPALQAAAAAAAPRTARQLARMVMAHPGIDQQGLCAALGLRNPAASKHMTRFEAMGLVIGQRNGRSRLYYPTDRLRQALLLLEPPLTVAQSPVSTGPATVAMRPSSPGTALMDPAPSRTTPAQPA